MAVINDCVHGVDWQNGVARMSLIRSASYSSSKVYELPLTREDAYVDRIDNGLRSFKFRFVLGGVEVEKEIAKLAEIFHKAPFSLCFFPSGFGEKPAPLAKVTGGAVCSAVKKAENGNDVVMRLYNLTDDTVSGEVEMLKKHKFGYEISPHRFVTYKINCKTGKAVKTNVTETK